MPRTEKQFEEIRKEKTDLIKQVAIELFANEGYHSTSIAKIAKTANISKGLLYNYFESKEALLKEIVNDGLAESFESLDKIEMGKLNSVGFEFYVRQNFKLLKEKNHFYKLFYTILMQPNVQEIVQHQSMAVGQRVMQTVMAYFTEHFDDPQTEMLIYSSLIKGLNMQILYNENITEETIEKAIQRVLELYKK